MNKYKFLSWFLCIFALIWAFFAFVNIFNATLSEVNYNYNKQFDAEIDGIIQNQSNLGYIKYGFGNIADNGCGAISLYNILCLDGKPEKLSEIIRSIDKNGLNFYGFVGTNPFTLSRKLAEKGYSVSLTVEKDNFESQLKSNKHSILVYFSLESGHFQLIDYDKEIQKFQLINPYQKLTYSQLLTSIKKYPFRLLISVN